MFFSFFQIFGICWLQVGSFKNLEIKNKNKKIMAKIRRILFEF